MLNQHKFQLAAKSFRAGKLSLQEFTAQVFESNKKPSSKTADQTARLPGEVQTIPKIPERPKQAHKGDFGRVTLIGGCKGMAGAISLSGLAALKSGSGLVRLVIPSDIQQTVASFSPSYMTYGCLSESNGEFHGGGRDSIESNAEWADVVGLGPGMERGEAQKWIVPKLYHDLSQPMVIDADGLNTLRDAQVELSNHAGQRVLTPHPGELMRLLDCKTTDRKELESRAIELAQASQLIVVLKGHRTLVTDGQQHFHNTTGNPGMATGGSGDVLTGVITSLIGQGLSLFDASVLGVHVHGLAGDLVAEKIGELSLTSMDILNGLPLAFLKLKSD